MHSQQTAILIQLFICCKICFVRNSKHLHAKNVRNATFLYKLVLAFSVLLNFHSLKVSFLSKMRLRKVFYAKFSMAVQQVSSS